MEAEQFKTLLDQVNTLNNHYKKINQITGENFNIFRILKLESSEVRLHSAFLAELLNPKGNHGQKHTFLKLFIDAFCFKGNIIDSESCTVEIEKHTISINETFTEGGRIDIVITDKIGNQIIIENKIYAGDQKNQMLRYYNYAPKADLIYLTLDRKEPDKSSIGDLIKDEHYKCISYESAILRWLEQCRKEVAIYPIVRESITQYINLIKYLTNQTLNNAMQEELNFIIKSNLEASFLIVDNLNRALNSVSKEFGIKLEKEFKAQGFVCDYKVNFSTKYSGFWIKKEEWKKIRIGFEFQSSDKDLIYGFNISEDHVDTIVSPELIITLKLFPNNNGSTTTWPWLRYMDKPYDNWKKLETWQTITDGRMMKLIKEKVDMLLELTKGMDL